MMSHLCNRCVRELLILARTWFAFVLPSKPGVTTSPERLGEDLVPPSARPCPSFALSMPSRSHSSQCRPRRCPIVLSSSPGLRLRLGHGELHRSPVRQGPTVVFPSTDPSAQSVLNLSPTQVRVCHRHGFSSSGQPEPPRTMPSCSERHL
jgi:hypothetical protein